jgi:hypothetical protein
MFQVLPYGIARVGFEPTTSGHQQLSKAASSTTTSYLKGQLLKEKITVQIPPAPFFFFFLYAP